MDYPYFELQFRSTDLSFCYPIKCLMTKQLAMNALKIDQILENLEFICNKLHSVF